MQRRLCSKTWYLGSSKVSTASVRKPRTPYEICAAFREIGLKKENRSQHILQRSPSGCFLTEHSHFSTVFISSCAALNTNVLIACKLVHLQQVDRGTYVHSTFDEVSLYTATVSANFPPWPFFHFKHGDHGAKVMQNYENTASKAVEMSAV